VKTECVLVAMVSCLVSMSMIRASAAPREIEDFCLEQLQQATVPHRRAAGEAFMANCIANLTAVPMRTRKYRKH
jgi:hypothetical protein